MPGSRRAMPVQHAAYNRAMTSERDRRLPPVYRVAELRTVEARHAGLPLMERAGAAATDVARAMVSGRGGPIVVLAGPGNNGGDGFVVARLLRDGFFDVHVVFRDNPERLPADAGAAYRAYVAAGGTTVADPPPARPALIVDALFGIGLSRPLPPEAASLVTWANASGVPILALDIPTGLHADTGIATAPAIRAKATATFIALKPGLLTAEGPDFCGAITVHSLGLAADATAPATGRALDWNTLSSNLPEVFARRVRAVHKGTFGTLGVVGGATGMTGAPLLAGRAALRAGAGKVWVGFAAVNPPAVDCGMPELMLRNAEDVLDATASAYVVGCGLGTDARAHDLVARALAKPVPIVLDADALTLLGADPALRAAARAREAATIVTPHPAEAARLTAKDVAAIQHDRVGAALAIAQQLHAHVVLKGAGSVLAHPAGTFAVNRSGNPALSVAGTGDVLAGIAGACLAQQVDAEEALRIAVCLHGAAADLLVARGIGPVGVGASELPDAARDLLNRAGK
jgi:hydroxyethylthiazole kinase-like uncharacterized protein yjeF